MGIWLKSKGLLIDCVLSSPATRTRQTTQLVTSALGLDKTIVEFKEELYHASPDTFFRLIKTIPGNLTTVLIVSHNDGITQFANQLTETRIDYMQPGSVFAVSMPNSEWTHFETTKKKFLFYKEPER